MTEPSLTEIIREAVDARLLDVMTALPAKVESYDRATRTATVTLGVRRAIHDEIGDVQHEEVPAIPNVPVHFPQGGGSSITWDLAAGDYVLLVFCSWAIGHWREDGSTADPVDLRKHSLGNAIAIAGITPKNVDVPTEAGVMVIETPMAKVGKNASHFVSDSNKVGDELTALKTAFNNWTPMPNDGGAALKTLLTALITTGWPHNTACGKLKSE